MRKLYGCIVAGVFVAFTGVPSSKATLTVYTDQTSWSAAAGVSTVETFATDFVGALSTGGAYSNSVHSRFTLYGNGNGDTVGIYQAGIANSGPDHPIPASFLGQNYLEWGNTGDGNVGPTTTFTFLPATTAFGFDWFNTDLTDQYQIVINGNTYSGPPFTVAPNSTTTGFFGVVATGESISTATISTQRYGGYISDEGLDNVRVAVGTLANVPEPGTVAITGLAMLGAGVACRKHLKKSEK